MTDTDLVEQLPGFLGMCIAGAAVAHASSSLQLDLPFGTRGQHPPSSSYIRAIEAIILKRERLFPELVANGLLGSHLTLIFCIFRYFLSWIRMNYYTRMAQFSYRLAFVAAAVTYGIVVYKTLRARAKAGLKITPQIAVTLLADENVQYLRMFPAEPSSQHESKDRPRLTSLLVLQ